jgi:hypothetical protein
MNSCRIPIRRNGRGRGFDGRHPGRKLKRRAAELHEFNPMLGFRGVRLAIAYPEIAEMQARAIFEAAVISRGQRPAARHAGNHGAAGDDLARA